MVALEGVSPCLGISRHSLHNLYGCAGQDLLRPGGGENVRGKPLKNLSPQCKKITFFHRFIQTTHLFVQNLRRSCFGCLVPIDLPPILLVIESYVIFLQFSLVNSPTLHIKVQLRHQQLVGLMGNLLLSNFHCRLQFYGSTVWATFATHIIQDARNTFNHIVLICPSYLCCLGQHTFHFLSSEHSAARFPQSHPQHEVWTNTLFCFVQFESTKSKGT